MLGFVKKSLFFTREQGAGEQGAGSREQGAGSRGAEEQRRNLAPIPAPFGGCRILAKVLLIFRDRLKSSALCAIAKNFDATINILTITHHPSIINCLNSRFVEIAIP
jgi:hypothetical protein